MSAPYQPQIVPAESRPHVRADIRRQLEGGIELLEKAHTRYALLVKLLKKRQWQAQVQTRLEALREVARQEAALLEALTRLHQRAQAEDWPDTEPALVLARKVRRLRTQLEALTRDRLGTPTTGEAHLAANLARLDQLLTQTLVPPFSPEEPVLYQGEFLPSPVPTLVAGLVGLGLLFVAVPYLESWPSRLAEAACLMLTWFFSLPILIAQVLRRYRSGQFWLTQKRLIWKPTIGDAIHISLQAIPPDGVQRLSPMRVQVKLVDGRRFHLAFLKDADRLVSLLALPRQF